MNFPVTETRDETIDWNPGDDSGVAFFPGRKEYEGLIRKTIRFIHDEDLGKIVISRAQKFEMSIAPLPVFKRLVKKYPAACVYLFTHPETGTWMGATPETLLKKQGRKISTMSLAGTRKRGEEDTFTVKEEKEQQLVTDFISGLFKREAGLHDPEQSGPELSEAGNLVHFKTEISAVADPAFDENPLIGKLHPTPAVAGYPQQEALAYIDQNEGYNRTFYSGYFGLKTGRNFHYFVNLRCMQIFANSVVLYAGGGITKNSDPGAEWEETEAKMRTLLDALE